MPLASASRLIAAGDIGFAEGFLDEDWTTPDLTALIRLAAQNREALAPAIDGSLLMRLANRFGHLLNANTRRGSRRNIEGITISAMTSTRNGLIPMLYSSAIFDGATLTLEAAQHRKLECIREKLKLDGGESVLENPKICLSRRLPAFGHSIAGGDGQGRT